MHILVLTRYGRLGASSRLRFLQLLPELEGVGLHFTVGALIDDEMLLTKYRNGSYQLGQLLRAYAARLQQLLGRHRFDLLWIEKEALPWLPAWLERMLLREVPYVLDFDDAIFHNYDLHANPWVRRWWGRRIDRLMAGAKLVVAGNQYLAQRARDARAARVEIVPTVVDLGHYPLGQGVTAKRVRPRVVWIGSPATVPYLADLAAPLQALAGQVAFTLRVIGGELEIPGVDVECLRWSEEKEGVQIAECDVGIMPLSDTPWSRGKCGYKLLQYMACGLPVVASPVGANLEIVSHAESGYFATTEQEWVERLGQLLADPLLRRRMGEAGRHRLETAYSLQTAAPAYGALLQAAAVAGSGVGHGPE